MSQKFEVIPSEIIENTLNYQGKPVSFEDYIISREIINSQARTLLYLGGRQISKSTTLGFRYLGRVMTRKHHHILHVSPKMDQAQVFSKQKIQARINESPKFKKWFTDKESTKNISEKGYTNGCYMYFRGATQEDTIRGIAVNEVDFDEIQDIPSDTLPVIEETITGQKDPYRVYAGTAKSLNNLSTILWHRSSQISPILICPDCRKHNIPYLDNISKEGLRCKFCKGFLSVRPPHIYLKAMGESEAQITGFWVPQIALPLHVEIPLKWAEVWRKFNTYSADKFMNEVLGLPAGAGLYLISEDDLKRACQPEFMMWDTVKSNTGIMELVAGIDWAATNSKSFTVLTIGGFNYRTGRFTVVYLKKYLDDLNSPMMLKHIVQTLRNFGVKWVGADWGGGGFLINPILETYSGIPVYQVMYTGERKILEWDTKARFFKASRTRTLLELFKHIKSGKFHFYEWSKFSEIKSHFLAEFAEEREDRSGNELLRFDHNPDDPDDALHALNVMFMLFKKNADKKIQAHFS